MRTTIDLPDDLHQIVSSLAQHRRVSLSHSAVELMRRGLGLSVDEGASALIARHSVTGLPVLATTRVITPDDVKALDDE